MAQLWIRLNGEGLRDDADVSSLYEKLNCALPIELFYFDHASGEKRTKKQEGS